jgi:hypothetical protein
MLRDDTQLSSAEEDDRLLTHERRTRRIPPGARAAATIVAALALASCAVAPRPSQPGRSLVAASPEERTADASPTPGASIAIPSAPDAALTWVGDPTSVAEATEHRDTALDDTELAVAGFAWQPAGDIFCPAILPASPAMEHCPDQNIWISDEDPARRSGRSSPGRRAPRCPS